MGTFSMFYTIDQGVYDLEKAGMFDEHEYWRFWGTLG